MAESQSTRGIARILVDLNNNPIVVVTGDPSTGFEGGLPAMGLFRPFGPASPADSDGDWAPFSMDGDGAVYVKIVGTVSTSSSSTTGGRPLLFYYDPGNPFPLFPVFGDTEYQWAGTANGAGHVNLRDAAGAEVGTNDSPLRVSGYRGSKTDRSGTTHGTPNTSSQVMAANADRRSLFIQNVSDTTLWIRFGAAANQDQPSIKLLPNSVYWEEGLDVDPDALNVICSAASKSYTAWEK